MSELLNAEQLFGNPQLTAAEISAGFHKWKAQLKTGSLQELDSLIERDKGTVREKMWHDLRADLEQFLADCSEASE